MPLHARSHCWVRQGGRNSGVKTLYGLSVMFMPSSTKSTGDHSYPQVGIHEVGSRISIDVRLF